ncbi:MAG: ABC transporter substrate-binding protein [Ignavibacteriales bacterium]
MKRRIALFLVIGLLAGMIAGCSQPQAQAPKEAPKEAPKAPEVIKIGHAVALTGDASIWGQSESNALKMWVEKVNQQGGVNGKKIEIVAYDTRADSVEAVNVVKRMIEQDKVVAIIGAAQSGVTIAMTSVTEPAKIPIVATTATNPAVTLKDGVLRPYTFRVCFIDPFQGTVAAQFASTKLNAKKAAILYDVGSDYSSWLGQYFAEAFEKMGGKVVAKEAFRSGELDYRAMLGKINKENPDVIFIPTAQKEAALAMKQARDLGYKGQFLGGDNWGSPDIISLGGSAVEGSHFVNLASMDDPDIQDFIKEYKAKYNSDPVLPNPVMAVDALLALVEAMKKAGSTDGTAIAKALEGLKDLQVLTGKFTVDPATHNPLNKPAVIQQIKGGQFIFADKYVTK